MSLPPWVTSTLAMLLNGTGFGLLYFDKNETSSLSRYIKIGLCEPEPALVSV